MNNVLEPFFKILSEEENQHAHFQQYNATAKTSQLWIIKIRRIKVGGPMNHNDNN
jgi:hypothetical protein